MEILAYPPLPIIELMMNFMHPAKDTKFMGGYMPQKTEKFFSNTYKLCLKK